MVWKGRKPERLASGVLCLALAVSFPSSSWAHKIEVLARAEGNRVHVEAYYSGGKKVVGGKVSVLDAMKELVVQGQTDRKGRFSFDVPKPQDLQIAVTDGGGHRGTVSIDEGDFPAHRSGSAIGDGSAGRGETSYESGGDLGESKGRGGLSGEAIEENIERKAEGRK